MIGNSCLLDTSIIIHAFKNTAGVSDRLDIPDTVFVPSVVAGELLYGALRSDQKEKHIA